MSLIAEALNAKIDEYKKKTYDELLMLVDDDIRLTEDFAGKTYNFVVRVKKEGEELKVMVECSKDSFLQHLFFKFKCFAVNKSGEVKDTEPF